MKTLLSALFACACAVPAVAQAQDVGLTLNGGLLTVIYGQACGPVGCAPFVGGPVAAGSTRVYTHYSAPVSLYAVAIGMPGQCVAVPGIDNALLLQNPIVLSSGLTPAPPFVPIQCQQTFVAVPLTLPAGTPPGIVFRVQSFGQSLSGQFAFGPAIESTTV